MTGEWTWEQTGGHFAADAVYSEASRDGLRDVRPYRETESMYIPRPQTPAFGMTRSSVLYSAQ